MPNKKQNTDSAVAGGIVNRYTGKDYLNATGSLKLGLSNDYIFRIVFQENLFALKGLLCSVLRLSEEEIVNLEIKNPIKPGNTAFDKQFTMDVKILMNTGISIDLEMQLRNYSNWYERSLSYLCRDFDRLARGRDYEDAGYAYQIGFLGYTLFPDHPEFRAQYQVRNSSDNHLYTGKFNLIVVSLNQTDLATQEDIDSGLVSWVRLFKAKTWEELKMIAADNKYMESAVESTYLAEDDYYVTIAAIDREAFLRSQARAKAERKELKKENAKLSKEINNLNCENTQLLDEVSKLRRRLADAGLPTD